MSNGRTIAIDFDGVIHNYSKGWFDGTVYDYPVAGTRNAIRKLRNKGYQVVIFTAREKLPEIHEWLIKEHIEVDSITNKKPKACAYIDDRAIRFTNWKDMLNYF